MGLHGGVGPGGVVESRFGARGGARHVAVMGHKLVCIIMPLCCCWPDTAGMRGFGE